MHKSTIPDDLRQRLRAFRGRDHVYDSLEPRKTAHLCVDMQNHFVAGGALSEVPMARRIVPNINRLAAAVRDGGGLNVWIRVTVEDRGFAAWDAYFDRFVPQDMRDDYRAALKPGHEAHKFWPELDIHDEDMISDKSRFSAMIQGASDLEQELRGRGLEYVLITGTVTNVCCESTARDAAMRDFKVIMVEDGCAARTEEDHAAGLRTMAQVFGDVRTTDDVIALLRRQGSTSAA